MYRCSDIKKKICEQVFVYLMLCYIFFIYLRAKKPPDPCCKCWSIISSDCMYFYLNEWVICCLNKINLLGGLGMGVGTSTPLLSFSSCEKVIFIVGVTKGFVLYQPKNEFRSSSTHLASILLERHLTPKGA